jgi:ribosome biogenesis GTPase
VADGFREIRQLAADCRFANCRHLREPGCAVKSAVVSNEVSERRYESYNRLRVMSEQAGKDRG